MHQDRQSWFACKLLLTAGYHAHLDMKSWQLQTVSPSKPATPEKYDEDRHFQRKIVSKFPGWHFP